MHDRPARTRPRTPFLTLPRVRGLASALRRAVGLPPRRSLGLPPGLSLASALVLVLGAAGCSGAPAEDPDAGVQIPSEAIHPVGTSDALTLVRDLELASDGTIWVLDEHPPFFVGFRDNGEVVAELGRRGAGPLELTRPVGLLSLAEGESGRPGLWTFDRERHAFVRVAEPGASHPPDVEGSSVQLPSSMIRPGALLPRTGGIPGMFAWMSARGGSAFVAHPAEGSSRGSGYWVARVVEIPLEGGEPAVRWSLGDHLPSPEAYHPGATELLPFPLWALCPDGEAWLYDPARHEVRSLRGAEERTHALPPARRVALTPDRLIDLVLPSIVREVPSSERPPEEILREELARELAPMIDQFADVFPEYYQMLCAPDGTLWLQHFDGVEGVAGAGWRWERLSGRGDGTGPDAVRFPEDFQLFRITSDRAWGIVMDDLDIPSVAWVELPGR